MTNVPDRRLDTLLEEHLPRLQAYVHLEIGERLRRREDTFDLLQSVCREVLQDADRFEFQGEAAFRSWLYKQALHKIVNKARFHQAARRDVRRDDLPADVSSGGAILEELYGTLCSPTQHAIGQEARQSLERAFERLAPEQREAVVLKRIVGLDYEEIAEQMGKTVGAVRVLVHRGVARLAVLLGQD